MIIYISYIKRPFDFSAALVGLLMLSPIFILVTIGLFFANNGKPFFFQKRPGKNGRIFSIIKFKTMNDKKDAEGNLLEDTNVLFLLIGQGMEKARLIQKAKEMQVKNVRFLDPVPKAEVFKYIIASEMGASVLKKVNTFKTVYSNKTFDYFSCKKPILMAIDGVSRELVELAKAGTYVEPENPLEYNRVIRNYMKNLDLLKVEGNNGYIFAKENFDRDVLAKKYINEISKLNL